MTIRGLFASTVPPHAQPRYSSEAVGVVKKLLAEYFRQGQDHPHFSQLKIGRHESNLEAILRGLVYGGRSTDSQIQVKPVTASLVVTPDCVLGCRACPYQHVGARNLEPQTTGQRRLPVSRLPRIMDRHLARHSLSELSKAGVKGVIFTGGGEPLLYQDELFEIMKMAKQQGFQLGLFTNGVLGRQDLLTAMVKELAPQLQFIRISLNACNPETYAQFHRTSESNFQKVTSNAMFLAQLRWQGVFLGTLGLGFLVDKSNVSSFSDMLDLIESLTFDQQQRQVGTIDYAVLRPQVEYERLAFSGRRPEQQLISVYNEISAIHTKLTKSDLARFIKIRDFRLSLINERFQGLQERQQAKVPLCVAHPWRTAVWWDGGVYTCDEHNGEEGFLYGNLRDNDWEGIWFGEGRRSVIADLNREHFGRKCPPICVLSFLNELFYPLLQLNARQGERVKATISNLQAEIPPRDVNFL